MEYKTTEVWYPYDGGGEMIEVPDTPDKSNLATAVNE